MQDRKIFSHDANLRSAGGELIRSGMFVTPARRDVEIKLGKYRTTAWQENATI